MIALSGQVIAMNIAATTASAMRPRRKAARIPKWLGWVALVVACGVALGAGR